MRGAIKKQFVKGLQTALNHYLKLDPESKIRMSALHNKVVLIEMSAVEEKLFFYFSGEQVTLLTEETQVPDTVIRGTPLRLLQLSLSPATRQKFFSDDVTITGNLEAGQQVIRLFDEMEIDWEEQLSKLIGDGAAFRVGSFARRIKDWFAESKESVLQDVNDYLHEEKKFVPSVEAMQDFYHDIDTLRLDADRLEARIAELSMRLQQSHQRGQL